MKLEPIFEPAPSLTEMQRVILRASAVPKGGPYPVKVHGAGEFASARKLVDMGLGLMDGRAFTANARGRATVAAESEA